MNAEERRQIAEAADFCVQWIKAQGLKVAHIEGTVEKPCIVVKYRPACDRFDEIIHAYERGERGEQRYAYVTRFGCIIKWFVPAENPHKVEVMA